jgi:hypothetical protein
VLEVRIADELALLLQPLVGNSAPTKITEIQ